MKVQGSEVGGIDKVYVAAKAEGTIMGADCAARNKQELLKARLEKNLNDRSSSPRSSYPGNDQQVIIQPEPAELPPLAPQPKSQNYPRQCRERPCDDISGRAKIRVCIWKLCCPVVGGHGVVLGWVPPVCSRK